MTFQRETSMNWWRNMKAKISKISRKEMKLSMFVIKRNGSIEEFNKEKIEVAKKSIS